ncbi:MAG: hemolysin III family protein, partial [Alphaproteobacteria bacterium]|nr:hemolysin III family protein [Alphaproteobacteria bacterium]
MDRARTAQRQDPRRIGSIGHRLLQKLTRARRAVYIKRAIEHGGETIYEELANAVVAGVAAVLAAAGLALLVVLAAYTDNAKAVTSVAIYGATLFLAFLFSSLYHGVWHRSTKRVLLVLDHISIFLLIAGTYTPITLIVLPQPLGWTLF